MEKFSDRDTPSLTPSTDDIIWEVSAIANTIGRTERQTNHLLAKGQLPAKKVGGRWVASRRKLLAAVLGDAVEELRAKEG